MRALPWLSLAVVAAAPSIASAQADSTAGPMVGPPIQRITTASAVSTEPLGAVTSVRELPDGRVLLNDGTRRRLLLMDTALKVVDVVLDSLSDIANRISTHREAVSRELSRLATIGLLRREGGNLRITNRPKLTELVHEAKGD